MPNTPTALAAYLAIAPQSPEAAVLRLLIELGLQVANADEGSLLVIDEAGGDLVFAMTAGSASSEEALRGQRVPLGQGLAGLAAATREVQIGAPTYAGVEQARDRAATGAGPQAVIAAPMLVADTVVGVITAVSFAAGRRFDARDGELFGRLAAVAGLVVQQRRRIAALERGGASASGSAAALGGDDLEAQIIGSVGRIARFGTDSLRHVASLLAAVEALHTSARS